MSNKVWAVAVIGLAGLLLVPAVAATVGVFTWFAITVWKDVLGLL